MLEASIQNVNVTCIAPAWFIYSLTETFVSPAKNSAQCIDAQSKLHSIREQNDFKTNLLNKFVSSYFVPKCCVSIHLYNYCGHGFPEGHTTGGQHRLQTKCTNYNGDTYVLIKEDMTEGYIAITTSTANLLDIALQT